MEVGPEPIDPGALSTELIERSPDLVVLLDQGIIRYVSPAIRPLTGWAPEDVIGRHIVDLVHPDDVERAAFDLELYTNGEDVPGSTNYGVALADGSWARFEVSSAAVTIGEVQYLALYCRRDQRGAGRVLYGLLRNMSTADTYRRVCDVFNWELHGSRVAVSWSDDEGVHSVGTGLPAPLTGGDNAPDTPWARCRREARPQRATELAALDGTRRRVAEELGLGAYWIEPVIDDEADVCALITLWMRAGGPVPELHSLGMTMAKDYVELIVRWTRQRRMLHDAAHRDMVTGLDNRKVFFDLLATEAGGAILYCDLDSFKRVNDEFGHAAGDELLRAVAARIKACVRVNDVVARIGGDEFTVLCRGVTRAQALELAQRIRDAVFAPYRILDTTARVGISIGVAHSSGGVGEELLDQADRALYRAKGRGGNVACGPDDDGDAPAGTG